MGGLNPFEEPPMSIVRPTAAQKTRRWIVLGAAVFAVVVAQAQMGLGWGQSAAAFAADSDATLKVAGWAFAIWGLIYLGLLVYAVRQALPQTGESDLIHDFGWPSVLAFAGIGLWIVAAAFDWELATIVLIFGSLTVLLIPLLTHARQIRTLKLADRDRWMTVWPLSLLAGWLSIAAPVNLITVATGNGDLPAALSPTLWAGNSASSRRCGTSIAPTSPRRNGSATLPTKAPRVIQGPARTPASSISATAMPRLQDGEPQPPVLHRALSGRGDRRRRHPARRLHHGRAADRAMNALRFGDPITRKTRHLVAASLPASAATATSFGVPTVGGEVNFHAPLQRQHPGQRHDGGPCQVRRDLLRKPRASAIPSSISAPRRAATASTARPWRLGRIRRGRSRRSAPPCRSAIPSPKSCCSKPASS
jgi:hypothetical protein